MFKRWLEIEENKSALIIGPRRVGKTTLLKNFFPGFKYVTLDDLDDLRWAKKDPKGFISSLGKKAIVDEIQRAPELTIAVKHRIDNENAVFMMTGSSSIGLLDSAADSMAGRFNLLSLPTCCYGENLGEANHRIFDEQLNPKEMADANRQLDFALDYGHFPEVLNQEEESQKELVLKNYRDTYFTRDLIQLANIENTDALLSILHNLARSTGSTLEISNFAREAGISFPTAKKYLNILSQCHLIINLQGYQYGPAKRFIKSKKTYYADCGILQSLNVRLNKGQIVESFVIAEFEKRRKLGMLKTDQLYYYKSRAGREIDLVFESQDRLNAIEIKSNETVSPKDLRNLREFAKNSQRPCKLFLFYLGTEYHEEQGVNILPVASLFRGSI